MIKYTLNYVYWRRRINRLLWLIRWPFGAALVVAFCWVPIAIAVFEADSDILFRWWNDCGDFLWRMP